MQRQVVADWRQGSLILEVTVPLTREERYTPDARFLAESAVENLLPVFYVEGALPLALDSWDTVGSAVRRDPELYQRLSDLAVQAAALESSHLSRDLSQVRLRERFPFYGQNGLIAVFLSHSRPAPIPRVLGFVPSADFTGLVIYAKGDYPSHGKDLRQPVRPALFPEIYDEEMNLVLDARMCDPEMLERWGMVAYTDDPADRREDRVGTRPLRIVARGVFGRNATDIVIAREDAERLLSRQANRDLLRQGRILVIIDQPVQASQLP